MVECESTVLAPSDGPFWALLLASLRNKSRTASRVRALTGKGSLSKNAKRVMAADQQPAISFYLAADASSPTTSSRHREQNRSIAGPTSSVIYHSAFRETEAGGALG